MASLQPRLPSPLYRVITICLRLRNAPDVPRTPLAHTPTLPAEREHLAVGQLERAQNKRINTITLEELGQTAERLRDRLIFKLLGSFPLVLALSGLGPATPTPLALLALVTRSHKAFGIGMQRRRIHSYRRQGRWR
jgi:hypothetical protein